MPYTYLEDIATADAAFRAWGKDLGELFSACADALMNVMVEDLETIAFEENRPIALKNKSMEMLLFEFLQEFIFYKDAELLLLRVSEMEIKRDGDEFQLKAEVSGERINSKKHPLNVDVKAVTMHRFKVTETKGRWEAEVVVDI